MRDEKRTALRFYLAVGCGAAIGSLLRFLSGVLIVSVIGGSALWATGFVNVVGSFIIGLFAALAAPDGRLLVSPAGRQFVMGGICGGFTTFSAMSLDTFILLLQGDIPLSWADQIREFGRVFVPERDRAYAAVDRLAHQPVRAG